MEPMTLIAIAGWVLVGTAFAVSRLPIGSCRHCDHCRAEQAREAFERAQGTREADLKQAYGVGRCRRCGQYHRIDGPC